MLRGGRSDITGKRKDKQLIETRTMRIYTWADLRSICSLIEYAFTSPTLLFDFLLPFYAANQHLGMENLSTYARIINEIHRVVIFHPQWVKRKHSSCKCVHLKQKYTKWEEINLFMLVVGGKCFFNRNSFPFSSKACRAKCFSNNFIGSIKRFSLNIQAKYAEWKSERKSFRMKTNILHNS